MTLRVLDLRQLEPLQTERLLSNFDDALRTHIGAMRRSADRLRSIAAYALAQQMLAEAGVKQPIPFSFEPNGKPYVGGGPFFSLSHSGDFVACAVAERPVGVDIETFRPLRAQLACRVCCEEEAGYVFPDGDFDVRRFLRLWTAKEAVLKCTGEGIRGDLRSVQVMSQGMLLCCGFSLESRSQREYVLCTAVAERNLKPFFVSAV